MIHLKKPEELASGAFRRLIDASLHLAAMQIAGWESKEGTETAKFRKQVADYMAYLTENFDVKLMSPEEERFLDIWSVLSPAKKERVLKLIQEKDNAADNDRSEPSASQDD